MTLIGSALSASLVAGCATIAQLAPPVAELRPGAAATDDRDPELAVLREGRRVYVTGCARCHSPEAVTAYTREQWRSILPRMAAKSRLSAEDRRAVAEYIDAVLTAHESGPAPRAVAGGAG